MNGARGLAVFVSGDFFRPVPVAGSVPDDVHVGRSFHLAPLAQLVGRDDGAIVAFIGRERGQVFRLRAGRLDEIVDRTRGPAGPPRPGRHFAVAAPAAPREARRRPPEGRRLGARPRRPPRCTRRRSSSSAPRRHGRSSSTRFRTRSRASSSARPRRRRTPARASCSSSSSRCSRKLRPPTSTTRSSAGGRGPARTAVRASGWADTLTAASDSRVELLLHQEGADQAGARVPAVRARVARGGRVPARRHAARAAGLGLRPRPPPDRCCTAARCSRSATRSTSGRPTASARCCASSCAARARRARTTPRSAAPAGGAERPARSAPSARPRPRGGHADATERGRAGASPGIVRRGARRRPAPAGGRAALPRAPPGRWRVPAWPRSGRAASRPRCTCSGRCRCACRRRRSRP